MNIEQLKNLLFTYEGRLNRKPYTLFILITGITLNVLIKIVGMSTLTQVVWLLILIPSIMVSIKRLHDLDKSGWFTLLLCIPIINFFFGLYLMIVKGTEGKNSYGEDLI